MGAVYPPTRTAAMGTVGPGPLIRLSLTRFRIRLLYSLLVERVCQDTKHAMNEMDEDDHVAAVVPSVACVVVFVAALLCC